MRKPTALPVLFILLVVLSLSTPLEAMNSADLFPFPTEHYRLENGMEVVLIKWGNDGLMMDILIVDVGERYEKKPDEVEYTHLMEHLMFRGSRNYSVNKVNEINSRFGIYEQGVTESDCTFYFRIFPAQAFLDLTRIMVDKLTNLQIPPDEYKAETGAVLGEYLGHCYLPMSVLESTLYQLAYSVHPYRDVPEHLEVLKKMPEHEEEVMKFYHSYYKPNNCRLVIAGDYRSDEIKRIIQEQYGSIKPGKAMPEIPQEPPQEAEKVAHISYPGSTSPYLLVSYRLPPYDLNNPDIPALNLLNELYFSDSSDLYTRLVYKEKLVSAVYFPSHSFSRDPGLFTTRFKLKRAEDMEKVKEIFFEEIDTIRSKACDAEKLRIMRERNFYRLLTDLDSLNNVAFMFMRTYLLSGNPEGLNCYYTNYLKVTPSELRKTAEKYFADNKRIVITLVEKEHKGEK